MVRTVIRFLRDPQLTLMLGTVAVGMLWVLDTLLAQGGLFAAPLGLLLALGVILWGLAAILLFGSSVLNAVAGATKSHQILAWLAFLTVILMYAFSFAYPMEHIFGTGEQAMNASSAISLVKTGNLQIPQILKADLSKEVVSYATRWAISSNSPDNAKGEQTAISGAAQGDDLTAVRARVGCRKGFVVLLASFFDLGGWRGLLLANLVLMITSAAIVGLICLDWLGPFAATAILLLHLFFPLDAWYARSLYVEPAMGLLWLVAVYGLIQRERYPVLAGIASGVSLGLALAVSDECLLPVSGVALAALFYFQKNRRFASWLLAGLGSTASVAWYGNSMPSFRRAGELLGSWGLIWVGVLMAIGLGGILFRRQIGMRLVKHERNLKIFGTILMLSMVMWAWLSHAGQVHSDAEALKGGTQNALGWFGNYLRPLGLILAIFGSTALLWRIKAGWQWLFWGVGVASVTGFWFQLSNGTNQATAPEGVIAYGIPVMLAGVAAFPWFVQNADFIYPFIAVQALVIVGFVPANIKINSNADYAGSVDCLKRLETEIPTNAIVLIRGNSSLSDLAIPLAFDYNRECLLVYPPGNDSRYLSAMSRAFSAWNNAGRPVFLLTDRALARLAMFQTRWQEIDEHSFASTFTENVASKPGGDRGKLQWNCILFRAIFQGHQSGVELSEITGGSATTTPIRSTVSALQRVN